jgi:hypothetical protein
MATELVTGTSQLRFMRFDAQGSEQLRTGVAGQLFQVTAQNRGALVIRNISDWHPCGDHAKPCIEGSEFAQESLEGKRSDPSFLWTRRVLERLQTIQNQ